MKRYQWMLTLSVHPSMGEGIETRGKATTMRLKQDEKLKLGNHRRPREEEKVICKR